MKKYRVKVNGNVYEIELEEVKEQGGAAAKTEPAAAEVKTAPANASGGEEVLSPMPGNILSVNVSEGASVNKGDLLMVLEAMKMANNLESEKAGKVTAILVSQGASVMEDTPLVVVE